MYKCIKLNFYKEWLIVTPCLNPISLVKCFTSKTFYLLKNFILCVLL